MNWPPISRGLPLAVFTVAAAQAQTIGAGAHAVVSSDTLPVYTNMSDSAPPKLTLKRGERVTIGMVLFGSDTTWCAISRVDETKRLGYASCEFLEPDKAPSAPPPPKPPAPVTAHELAPGLIAPSAPKPAALPVKADGDVVDTIFAGTALRAEIANYIRTTRLPSFLDKGRLAEIDAAALDRVLAAQFQPGVFESAIGGQFRKGYSTEPLPALIDWVRSPTARKLAGLEQRVYPPASRQALVEFAASLSKTPPPEARLLLVHRIYDATRICDIEVETTIALVYTTAEAIGPALPKEKRYGSNELDRALGTVKSRYRSIMKNARIVQYLFAFQSASNEELEQYAAFLESDGGKWLTAAIDKGFFEATESISRRLREEIPRRVKARQH